MTALTRRYTVRGDAPKEITEALSGFTPLMQSLLFNRGITDLDAATTFLNPDYETERHDPMGLPDMEVAVERIRYALAENERIGIYTDYDCDGIPGAALMKEFFALIGYENFTNYIPHRDEEGYGVHKSALEKLAKDGVTLVITVDVGITDHDAVAHAKALGLDVIVTDHHLPKQDEAGHDVLPEALAVINPKRLDSQYPYPHLCGTGVAFKLIEALIKGGVVELSEGAEKWLLDLVGIATIADMVPLTGENRLFARYGLLVLRKTRRPGLLALFKQLRMDRAGLSEDDVGFMIAPRINAASRMDRPHDAFELLSTADAERARELAKHLDKINNERKGTVAAMVREMKRRVGEEVGDRRVIVLGNPEWKPALLGLAANTLAETYQKPVCLWGREGGRSDVFKGSCRSDGVVSVVELMEAAGSISEYGGHRFSCGFSVGFDDIHELPDVLHASCEAVSKKAALPEEELDHYLTIEEVTNDFYERMLPLAPFGEGNIRPRFLFQGVIPKEVKTFGKGNDHLSVRFNGAGAEAEGIAFYAQPESFQKPLEVGRPVDLVASVERSTFMGRRNLRLRIIDAL